MNISIELNSQELSLEIITKIKELFKNKTLKIVISETDTSEYLLSSEKNRTHLVKSVNEKEIVRFTEESFLEYSKSLIV